MKYLIFLLSFSIFAQIDLSNSRLPSLSTINNSYEIDFSNMDAILSDELQVGMEVTSADLNGKFQAAFMKTCSVIEHCGPVIWEDLQGMSANVAGGIDGSTVANGIIAKDTTPLVGDFRVRFIVDHSAVNNGSYLFVTNSSASNDIGIYTGLTMSTGGTGTLYFTRGGNVISYGTDLYILEISRVGSNGTITANGIVLGTGNIGTDDLYIGYRPNGAANFLIKADRL